MVQDVAPPRRRDPERPGGRQRRHQHRRRHRQQRHVRHLRLGTQCAISEGEPSEERHQLLRREALELALYTFKYGDADSVIALLPPRLPQKGERSGHGHVDGSFFAAETSRSELDEPLQNTLLAAEPPQVGRDQLDRGAA